MEHCTSVINPIPSLHLIPHLRGDQRSAGYGGYRHVDHRIFLTNPARATSKARPAWVKVRYVCVCVCVCATCAFIPPSFVRGSNGSGLVKRLSGSGFGARRFHLSLPATKKNTQPQASTPTPDFNANL